MNSDFKDGLQIVLLGVVLVIGVGLIFVLPVLLIVALPFFGGFVWYVKFRDSPLRAENSSRTLLLELYERTKNGTLASFSEVQIQSKLRHHLPESTPPNVKFHLLAVGRAFLKDLDLTTDVPSPPIIANSIEGARYKDTLARIGTHSPDFISKAIDDVAEILGYVARFVSNRTGSTLVPAYYFIPNMNQAVGAIVRTIFRNDAFKHAQTILEENLEDNRSVFPEDYEGDAPAHAYFANTAFEYLFDFSVPFSIPHDLRPSHHTIIAPSGSGKTTLFESMIVDDLKEDCAIVVIDSQRGLINKLAEHIDSERIILVDPATCVPALNLFAKVGDDDIARGRTLAMFQYIFASEGVDFTSQQGLLYDALSRLCMVKPGSSLVTMRDMCQPMATASPEYEPFIAQLDDNARSFFKEYNLPKNGRYDETRQAVLTRLQVALKNGIFAKMLGAKTMPLDILKAIEDGKVILVNTDSDRLQGGAKLLGRIFAGLVMQAVQSREPGTGNQVYMYIDEFGQDYAEDSEMLLKMFTQTRKYNLGMVVCYQHLKQLTPDLKSAMASSTAIRMASMVSDEDENTVAGQLRTTVPELRALPPYTFMAYFRGIGTMPWKVEDGKLESLPLNSPQEMEALRERMRRDYGEDTPSLPKKEGPEDFHEAF